MRPGRFARSGPWVQFGLTFMTGAAAGLVVIAWIARQSPKWGVRLFDLQGDGLDAFDAGILVWMFGQMAVLLHHVLPGIARD